MPDPKTLHIGDQIRILRVPDGDLRHREQKRASSNAEMDDLTADSIERIIAQTPIVRISQIDDDGCVWYETSITGKDGTEEFHTLLIYEDDTWELVDGHSA